MEREKKSKSRKVRVFDPSKPFKNAKWESFAHAYARGETQGDAAVVSGFAPNCAPSQGCKLAKRQIIKDRVAFIKSQTSKLSIERVSVSKGWVLQNLRDIVERAMQAVPVTDKEGRETGEWRFDGSVANRGVELIGKELGMFVERKVIGLQDLRNASADDLLAILSEIDSMTGTQQLPEGDNGDQVEPQDVVVVPESEENGNGQSI